MSFDYHIHLHYNACTSDEMTVSNIVNAGKKAGLSVMGLVNHLHPPTDMDIFRRARDEMLAAAEEDAPVLLLGVELDLMDPQGGTSCRDDVSSRVDYVMLAMGHVHLPWVMSDLSLSSENFLAKETESLLMALESIPVNIVAHPFLYPLLFRIAPNLQEEMRPHAIPLDLLEALAQLLNRKGVALELHCRDLFVRPERLGGEVFVHSYFDLLQFFVEKGVTFVAGSDAHYLDQIGRTEYAPSWARQPLLLEHVSKKLL